MNFVYYKKSIKKEGILRIDLTKLRINTLLILKKLINAFIKNGKKEKSQNYFLYMLKQVSIKKKELNLKNKFKLITTLDYINKSLNNIFPELYFVKKRRSRKIFYLPQNISEKKKLKIAII